MSSVRELDAEMPADGQPLAFTAQEPGEWVLATGQLDEPPYQLSAEATGATDWRAYANLLPFQLCRGAFCADYTSASLTPESPDALLPAVGRGTLRLPGRLRRRSDRDGLAAAGSAGLTGQPARTSISRGTALPRL